MTDKTMNLYTTTDKFENGIKIEGTGYPNKIKLRPGSFEQVNINVLNIIASEVKKEVTSSLASDNNNAILGSDNLVDTSSSIPDSVEKINHRAIGVKKEKVSAIISSIDSIIAASLDEEKTITDEEIPNEMLEQSDSDLEKTLQLEDFITLNDTFQEKEDVQNNDSEMLTDNNKLENENIDVNKIEEAYEQISQETRETLEVKENALQAQKRIQELEVEVQQKLDESNQKLQQISTEQAGIQSKKEEVLMRKTELEQRIVDTLTKQRKLLKQAKENYLAIISSAENRESELRSNVDMQTKENDSKILRFQEYIDRDNSVITEAEQDIARKERILEALSSPTDLNLSNEQTVALNVTSPSSVDEPVYKKVA